ncbi:MAG: hypothetical protein EBR79_04410 [Proteobacteria bacterium]|nr:hypothetical protein [Pseudomonadota bacterium]NBX85772.1 hypothetical protein [Pseudomonadota bacterium]
MKILERLLPLSVADIKMTTIPRTPEHQVQVTGTNGQHLEVKIFSCGKWGYSVEARRPQDTSLPFTEVGQTPAHTLRNLANQPEMAPWKGALLTPTLVS